MRFLHGYLEKIGKYHVFLRNWIAGFRGVKLMDFSRLWTLSKGLQLFCWNPTKTKRSKWMGRGGGEMMNHFSKSLFL